jgi:hypothetical protein
MQLSDMRTRVSQRLNEGATGPVFYTANEINAALNEANRFFVLLTLGLETTANWTVPAATTFTHMLTVFSDWIAPLRIVSGTGAVIRPATLTDLAALDQGWFLSPGSPQRYVALGADFLGIYQQPATPGWVLNVTYAQAPAPLVNDTDVPAIPAEYHARLVEYGIYRCRQGEGGQEFQKSLKYFDSFLDGATHYAAYVRSRNIGSRYDKVPFELEHFDRSKLLGFRPGLMPGNELAQGPGTVPTGVKNG